MNRTMKSILGPLRSILFGGAVGLTAFMAVGFCHTESYCFFWPTIDTVYADGYSEKAFCKLRVGMSMSEVNQIMCPPLGSGRDRDGVVRVGYTRDGGAPFGDFAWFGRSLYVKNGKVIRIVKTTYHD